jgi:ribonuclease Z
VVPAFGLRFHAYGRVLVFSGDTAPCEALSKAAIGADLLVQEVFVDRDMPVTAGVRSQATVDAVKSYHCTPDQIAEMANEAMVGAVLLTHIVPPGTDQARLISDIRTHFQGPVMVGEDLMQVDLIDRIMRLGRATIGY